MERRVTHRTAICSCDEVVKRPMLLRSARRNTFTTYFVNPTKHAGIMPEKDMTIIS